MKSKILITTFFTALIIISCGTSKNSIEKPITKIMNQDQNNLKKAHELIDFMEVKNLDSVMTFFDEEAIFAQPFNPQGEDFAYKGRKEIRNGLAGIFNLIKKINYTNKSFTVSDDGKTVFFETKGEMMLANGTPYNNSYVFRVNFNDKGKVIKVTEYMNSLYLAKIFGLIPSNK